jgi:hypothetical protein
LRRSRAIPTNALGGHRRPTASGRRGQAHASELASATLRFTTRADKAAARLAIAGASVLQIDAVTGHFLKDVEPRLDAHCHGREIKLAEAAAMKREVRADVLNGL